jgi:hypothetical protein
MDQERQYWVVSPTVSKTRTFLRKWKEIIRDRKVAILGWTPATDEKEYPRGKRMAERFAGIGDPSVQRGDVILIACGRVSRIIVGVGEVESDAWIDDSPEIKSMHDSEPVQMRYLKYFTWLVGASGLEDLRGQLKKALPHSYAMTLRPLGLEDPDLNELCKWLDRQLEDTRRAEASGRADGYGQRGRETPEHKKLKEWCARNPEKLGLSNVLSIPGSIDCSPCDNLTTDAADVIFAMRGGRYAVIEVETSNAKPGAYQALKYKILLCAHKGYPITSDKVRAILVAWQIPADVGHFCEQYEIVCHKKRLKPGEM